jgi:hypothetical protein
MGGSCVSLHGTSGSTGSTSGSERGGSMKVWTVLTTKKGSNYWIIANVHLTRAEARADFHELVRLFPTYKYTIRSAEVELPKARKVK